MSDILSDEIVTARKEHRDDGFDNVNNMMSPLDMLPDEAVEFKRRLKLEGQIQKGERYRRYTMNDGGELRTFKESLPMRDMCEKYELYDE